MKTVIKVIKKEGETPLECLNRFKKANPSYIGIPMTYAGRLDPLATGVLILLAGRARFNKQKYLNLDKKYIAQIIFGIDTDTHDPLGIIESVSKKSIDPRQIEDVLRLRVGKYEQKYPLYSSKTIKGLPLFTYGRKKRQVKLPAREVEIYKIEKVSKKFINGDNVAEKALAKIKKVSGDFRQTEISKKWKMLGKQFGQKKFLCLQLKIHCSSGFYVRAFARDLGKILETGAIAFSINRVKIG